MKPIAILLLLVACTEPAGTAYRAFLKPCNQVNIVVYNGGDTLFFNTRDSLGVELLTEQITGSTANPVADTCAAQGRLEYLQDSVLLFHARFAVTPGSSEARCNYIAYTDDDNRYTHKLSERAQKLLTKVMQTAR